MVAIIIVVCVIVVLLVVLLIVFLIKRYRDYNHANCEVGMNLSETSIAILFDKVLPESSDKLILNNLILPGIRNAKHTTQIDTLVICRRGIFVIETKDIHGIVSGYSNEKYWNLYYSNGERHSMYNPLWQNEAHEERVKELIERDTSLDIDDIEIIPMVIFFEGEISRVRDLCFDLHSASSHIASYEDYLDDETITTLKDLFTYYKENPVSTPIEHARYVQDIKTHDHNDRRIW